jgi:GAF domain
MSSLLEQYAQGAADRLGGPTFCSLTVSDAGRLAQVASSDPRAAACDQIETREHDGPCILAMDQLRSVLLVDIEAEHRWPRWREAALANGFRSFVAFPAYVDEKVTVAANIYSEEPATWSVEELIAMDVYVEELAEAMSTQRHDDRSQGS